MAYIAGQITLERATQIPADAVVNTWHCRSDGATDAAAAAAAFHTALETFYTSIEAMYAVATTSGNITAKYYNLADLKPRVPIYTDAFTITPPATTAVPAEVSICLSYKGLFGSGFPNARRRGRVYLGPTNTGTFANSQGDVHVASATRTLLANAATALLTASSSSSAFTWIVWSPTEAAGGPFAGEGGTGGGDFPDTAVTGGWVDDAFDTQRRRGARAINRLAWGS
jgi:hypothetical protein